MRVSRLLAFLAPLCLLVPLVAWPQQTTASATGANSTPDMPSFLPPIKPPTRDSQAAALVEASLTALGGQGRIAQIADCTIKAEVTAAPTSNREGGTLVYTLAGQEYRTDFTDAQGTQTIASGNGHPFVIAQGKATRIAPHQLRAMFSPPAVASVLLREFQDSNYSLTYRGTTTIGAEPVSIVDTSSQRTRLDSLVTPQTWYFDSASSLPVRIDYRLPDAKNPSHFVAASVTLSDFKGSTGVLFPFVFVNSINGIAITIASTAVTSVETNTGVQASTFDSPILGDAQ